MVLAALGALVSHQRQGLLGLSARGLRAVALRDPSADRVRMAPHPIAPTPTRTQHAAACSSLRPPTEAAGPRPGQPSTSEHGNQAAAQQYLQAVERAAQAVDVPAILAALQAPPPPGACPEDAQQPGLVSRAAAAAARRLARTAKPAYAQAFVEMCMDRRLLTPQQAVPAVDAVMQAYERQQDWHGVIAAAMRFLTGAAPRAATNPHLVGREQGQVGADAAALVGQRLFRACGRAAEPTTLQAAWHQLAPLVCWQGQQPPWPLVQQLLSACVECDLAACGVQLPDGGGSGGASSSAAGAGGGRVRQEEQRRLLAGQGGVAGVVFDPHSHYSEAVADLMARCAGDQQPVHHDHQQQQPEQQERRANGPVVPSHAAPSAAGGPRVPASNDWGAQQGLTLQALGLGSSCAPGAPPQPLLPTAAQVALLRLAASADEVDLLLGSRLISSRGAWAPDARLLQQQQRPSEGQQPGGGGGAGAAASDVARLQQLARQHAHADGSGNAIALAPRQLPVDFGHLSERAATAAVAAYASVCAWHKAAAVAQAALDGPGARAGPHAAHRTRPLQKLVRRQAAAGNLLAALNGMRQLQRLAPLPPRGGRAVKAQGDEQQLVPEERQQGRPGRAYVAPWTVAACLRAMAASNADVVGARGHPQRLAAFWAASHQLHPVAWAAYLTGLWRAGDRGQLLLPALLQAMQRPHAGAHAAGRRGAHTAPASAAAMAATAAAATAAATPAAAAAPSAPAAATDPADELGDARAHILRDVVACMAEWDGPELPHQRNQLRLEQLPVTRRQLRHVVDCLDWLARRGVRVASDAPLAAAVMLLARAHDTEDARKSGYLPQLLAAALRLGMQPGSATTQALLAVCQQLESRPGMQALGWVRGPAAQLLPGAPGVGIADVAAQVAAVQMLQASQLPEGEQAAAAAAEVARAMRGAVCDSMFGRVSALMRGPPGGAAQAPC